MKKIKLGVFPLVFLSLIFASCNKSANLDSAKLDELNHAKAEEELLRFEEALTYGISYLEEGQAIVIWKEGEKYDWDVMEIQDTRNMAESRKGHDCESSIALTFARCVKDLVDDGKCVTVGSDNGVYWGDVLECPK